MWCEGETEASIQEHHETLDNEDMKTGKRQVNWNAVSICHDKLFPERRDFILEMPIKSVVGEYQISSKYPLLFNYKQILAEFRRLTEKDLAETFRAGIKYMKLTEFPPYKKEEQLLKDVRALVTS